MIFLILSLKKYGNISSGRYGEKNSKNFSSEYNACVEGRSCFGTYFAGRTVCDSNNGLPVGFGNFLFLSV